jgi:hypothetical protein
VLADRAERAAHVEADHFFDFTRSGVIERLWGDFADLGPMEPHALDIGSRNADRAADLLADRSGTDHPRSEAGADARGLQSRMLKADGSGTTS